MSKIQRSDLLKISDCLELNLKFHLARDEMNATSHKAETIRYSPITSDTQAQAQRIAQIILEMDNEKSS